MGRGKIGISGVDKKSMCMLLTQKKDGSEPILMYFNLVS